MFAIKPCKCKTKPLKQNMRNKGKAKFSESLNNYTAFRESVENQMQQRISTNVAPKAKPRFQIA